MDTCFNARLNKNDHTMENPLNQDHSCDCKLNFKFNQFKDMKGHT